MKKEYMPPKASFLDFYVNEKICCVISIQTSIDKPIQDIYDKSHHHHGNENDHKNHPEFHKRHR